MVQTDPKWMAGGKDFLQRPGEMTGIVTDGGTMEEIVMTGTEVAETGMVEEVFLVMNHQGIGVSREGRRVGLMCITSSYIA